MLHTRHLGLAVVISISIVQVAAKKESSETIPDYRNLTYKIEISKKSFVLFEPVVVSLVVENPTQSMIQVHDRDDPLRQAIEGLGVQYQDEKPAAFEPHFRGGVQVISADAPETVYQPGAVLSEDVNLFFNVGAGILTFPKPGHYTLRGQLYVGGKYPNPIFLEAEALSIQVDEPAGADRQVIRSIGGEEALVTLFRWGPSEFCRDQIAADCLEKLESLLKAFPGSAYAPFLDYEIAKGTAWREKRENRYYFACDRYLLFLKTWPDHPLVPTAIEEVVPMLMFAGKHPLELEWIDRFEKQFPEKRLQLERIRQKVKNVMSGTDRGAP